MGYKKITLTEDHLKLIAGIKFEPFIFDAESQNGRMGWGIDQYSLFGGTYAMEDIALLLGHYGEFIPGTEESPLGKEYPKEMEDYMWQLYHDIWDNMQYIIPLLLYYSNKGGLTAGTYRYKTTDGSWTKID